MLDNLLTKFVNFIVGNILRFFLLALLIPKTEQYVTCDKYAPKSYNFLIEIGLLQQVHLGNEDFLLFWQQTFFDLAE